MDVSAKGGVRRYMHIVVDLTFMVDGGAGFDYAVFADFCIALDYRPLHNHRTLSDRDIFRNNSGRMDRGGADGQSVRYHFRS